MTDRGLIFWRFAVRAILWHLFGSICCCRCTNEGAATRHARVQDLERDFDFCVTVVVDGHSRMVQVEQQHTYSETARAVIPHAESDGLKFLEVFFEYTTSITMMIRKDVLRCIREMKSAPRLKIASQSCLAADKVRLEDGVLVLDFNSFNAANPRDWHYYLRHARPESVYLGLACLNDLSPDEFSKVGQLALEYLVPGGRLVVEAVDQYESAVQGALRLVGFNSVQVLPALPGGVQHVVAIAPPQNRPAGTCGVQGGGRCTLPALGVRKAFVINLARRPDRRAAMLQRMSEHGIPPEELTFFQAVDGEDLDMFDPETRRLFGLSRWNFGDSHNPYQNHGFVRSVLGVASSHHAIWVGIAQDEEAELNDIHLVFEDDAELLPGFRERWPRVLEALEGDYSWDALWLGVLDDRQLYNDPLLYPEVGVRRFITVDRAFSAGAFAYAIRKKGAMRFLEAADAKGIMQAVDWFMFDQFGDMVCYKADPPLATSPQGEGRDTDNAQDFPVENLLDDLPGAAPVTFHLAQPADGGIIRGDSVVLQGSFKVPGSLDLFLRRHQHGRMCVRHKALPDGEGATHQDTSLRDLGCFPINQVSVTLAGLQDGRHIIEMLLAAMDGSIVTSSRSTFWVDGVGQGAARAGDVSAPNSSAVYLIISPDEVSTKPGAGFRAVQEGNIFEVEVKLDQQPLTFSYPCGSGLYEAVRGFCVSHNVDPVIVCMDRLAAQAQRYCDAHPPA